jgi:polar amino acid transport system substrate-binding protein
MTLPRKSACRLFLLLGLALATQGAAAQSTLDRIQAKGSVAIGVMLSGPPYGTIDPNDRQPFGYNIDLARELARRLGTTASLVEVTPPNRVQFLQQGKVDVLIANMQWSAERAEILDFVPTAYDETGGAPVTRRDSPIRRWEDLRGQTVCVSQGSSYAKPLTELYGAQVAGYPGMAESLLALKGGNCVAAVHDGALVRHVVTDNPEWADYTIPIGTQIAASPSVIWLRKGDAALRQALDAIVRNLHRSGWLVEHARQSHLATDGFLDRLHDQALAGQL